MILSQPSLIILAILLITLEKNGAGYKNRTRDLLITNQSFSIYFPYNQPYFFVYCHLI